MSMSTSERPQSCVTAGCTTGAPAPVGTSVGSAVKAAMFDFPLAGDLAAPASNEIVPNGQYDSVLAAVRTLGPTRHSVTLALTEPLHNDVYQSLIRRGYGVATSNYRATSNGNVTESSYKVTVSIRHHLADGGHGSRDLDSPGWTSPLFSMLPRRFRSLW